MKVYIFFILILLSISIHPATAQHKPEKDTFRSFFESGRFDFHARTFYMSTINKNELTDFSSLAAGAGLGYYSPYFKNFQFGFSGFFIVQLYEKNVSEMENATVSSRYEVSLYDINDRKNKKNLDRLEELFLAYQARNLNIVLGRQKIQSPLINGQDNRMRPNVFSGLTAKYQLNNIRLEGGWLTAVSPRGTTEWYSMEDSYGIYPPGKSIFGEPSEYKSNISSAGTGLLGISYKQAKSNHQLWNYYADNVFNLAFSQSDFHIPVKKNTLLLGVQGFYQTSLNDGGNPDLAKAYMQTGSTSFGLGLRAGVSKRGHQLTVNYLGIGKQERFLFPREWGREIFYASLPRERYEGAGGVNAYVLKYEYSLPGKRTGILVGFGKADFPDKKDNALNKYGISSYYHFAGQIKYKARGVFEGMDVTLIAVNKRPQKTESFTDKELLNKLYMWNLNVVVDYNF